MKKHCAERVAKGLAAFVALLPVVAVPTAGADAVPPIPSPATVLTISPFYVGMSNQLQGMVCQSPNTCSPVNYLPFITPSGEAALQTALTDTSASKIIVFGYSNGTQVAEAWLAQHLNDPNAPSPDVLSFVLLGNPTRAFGGHPDATNGVVWPQSGYHVIDIAQQYDGSADYPNNPASPYYSLAVINAYAGFFSAPHFDYSNININDPANAVWKEGNITYVLTPTQNLPILGGFATLFPSLNAQMKDQIETAYIRPVPFPTTTQTASPATSLAASSALSTSEVSDPAATAATTPPPPTRPTKTRSTGTVLTAPPSVGADMLGTVQAITPPAEQPGLDNPIATRRSTTAPTARTTTSTADGNKVAPDNANGTVKPHRQSHGSLTREDAPAGEKADPGPN